MESNTDGSLLDIIDLARTLRQEQLFIQQEKATFAHLTEILNENSISITKLSYISAQQRRNLQDLIALRSELAPAQCCQRAQNLDRLTFIDVKKIFDYEQSLAYEQLFSYLYRTPYVLAVSLSIGDRLDDISPQLMHSVIHSISTSLFGNAINTKDVEMFLKLLRELIEIQVVVSEKPRRLLGTNSSVFARLYNHLNESMFSAKIFLTAALFEPIMSVLSDTDTILDVNPNNVIQTFSIKEKTRRFGTEGSSDYLENIEKFHVEIIDKLYHIANNFIKNLLSTWSLFPSTLRWLIQNMYHQLKQSHKFNEKILHEIITDMVFTHFICPAIVNPDIVGIVDAPISEQMRFNLMQIGQIINTLALANCDKIDMKYSEIYAKFECNMVTKLIDFLLESHSVEDVVPILAQQSEFERRHLLITQHELFYFSEFFRILLSKESEYDIPKEDREKLKKILMYIPEGILSRHLDTAHYIAKEYTVKEKPKQSLMNLSKVTRNKLSKGTSFNQTSGNTNNDLNVPMECLCNGYKNLQLSCNGFDHFVAQVQNGSNHNSNHSSPKHYRNCDYSDNPVLIINLHTGYENKLQLLSEDEVLKLNSTGQDIANAELTDTNNRYQLKTSVDKSSVRNGFDSIDGLDGLSDISRPINNKVSRFSLTHDDASIGNSDNLEAVSEVPSNHSVTSSIELEENDQNDNLSDMVSANVSGRGTPNISGRDTPSSQVTDGESIHNALPTPQMQKLISKARSDIEDKFCKFEIKKFEGDETVSIMSDTWSTDVLASDSEMTEIGDRDRERNILRPLVPNTVVLSNDNNFETLPVTRLSRNSYWDASDQRSESNWSTDVLASDSEKLNEIDTDDNASITTRSDITDAVSRFVCERDQLAAAISASGSRQKSINTSYNPVNCLSRNLSRTLSSINGHDAMTNNNRNNDVGSSGSNVSDRLQEDSAFYDAINSYDDNSLHDAINSSNYPIISSLARSSMRTTCQIGGENTFQQNYKSTNINGNCKTNFFIENISNQNVNVDAVEGLWKKCQHPTNKEENNENKIKDTSTVDNGDLIDFTDFVIDCKDKEIKNSINDDNELIKPSLNLSSLFPTFGTESVEHRMVSTEQRLVSFDGRRNGIMALKGSDDISLTPCLRRHQSLNYENHEIIISTNVPKRVSALPNMSTFSSLLDTKLCEKGEKEPRQRKEINDEQNEIILCNKISEIQFGDICQNVVEISNTQEINDNSQSPQLLNNNINGTSTLKIAKSTGAIPKSISFDITADKTRIDSSNYGTNNSGIFNKLKQGIFKHRRGCKTHRYNSTNPSTPDDIVPKCSRSVSFRTNTTKVILDSMQKNIQSQNSVLGYYDINEDILAKYRRKVSTSSEATNSSSYNGMAGTLSETVTRHYNLMEEKNHQSQSIHDKTLTFHLTKKKIRTVLSGAYLHSVDFRHTNSTNASPLLTYLQIQLAQAINLQDFEQISYVSEAIRCLIGLDNIQHTQLLEELQKDLQKRQSYLQYLMRYRQNLLLIMENIEQYESRLRSESNICNRYLMTVCIRHFIETRQAKLDKFQEDFSRLTLPDDKIDLIKEFINGLMEELETPGNGMLHDMQEWQIFEARVSLERILLQLMYQQVMFPNDDADLSRDRVLSEHIRKLQRVITPQHPALSIAQEYLEEAPWSFAQRQLIYITAYKTPREKLQCVIRCIASIVSLLRMSSDRAPAADDLLPILIYVVIMANPPYLLSTIEYITCFIGDKLIGEEQFNWTIFGSVVKFIKTMDYLDK